MRNIDAFVEHVLDVPPKHMKGKSFDGLFGDVKAYFGMVETQGGGTLHVHFLVWLSDAPPNTDAFDRAVAEYGDNYYHDIEMYADSIAHAHRCGELVMCLLRTFVCRPARPSDSA